MVLNEMTKPWGTASETYSFMKVNLIILLTFSSMLAALGQLFLKKGAHNNVTALDFFNSLVISGLFLYGVGTCIWVYALSQETLIGVYAFSTLSLVFVCIFGTIFLEEKLLPMDILGIILIISGLIFLNKP